MTMLFVSRIKFIIDLQTHTISVYLNKDNEHGSYELIDTWLFPDIVPFIKEMIKLLI
jgi:hypothetical protein